MEYHGMNLKIELEKSKEPRFHQRIAARAIIQHKDKYLMIVGKAGDCKLPGGGLEEKETLVEALIREVEEETGLTVLPHTIKFVGIAREHRRGTPRKDFEMESYYFFCEIKGQEEVFYQMETAKEASQSSANRDIIQIGIPCPDGQMVGMSLEQVQECFDQIEHPEQYPWLVRDKQVLQFLREQSSTET